LCDENTGDTALLSSLKTDPNECTGDVEDALGEMGVGGDSEHADARASASSRSSLNEGEASRCIVM
jgi:hypothetical protein